MSTYLTDEVAGHQSPQALAEELAARLGDRQRGLFDQPRLMASADSTHSAILHELCEILVDYCAYKVGPAKDVNPFDDPFVGAALLGSEAKVLGAHRKVFRNEPHAEPNALLNALEEVDTEEGHELLGQILKSYESKIWLNGPAGVDHFLSLFAQAGDIIRQKCRCPLVFISTLEPCRDFETQPSCSAILSAFRPDLVVYAADDLNPKGWGRDRLESAGIPVVANANVEVNLEANHLFYLSIIALSNIIESITPRTLTEIRYISLNNRYINLRADLEATRMRIHADPPDLFKPYVAHPPPMRFVERLDLRLDDVDELRTLFASSFDASWLLHYLRLVHSETGRVPGTLVFSGGLDETSDQSDSENLISMLSGIGIKVYLNVMRRQKELALARALIGWWSNLEDADQLVLLAKQVGTYSRLIGRSKSLSRASFDQVRRLTIVADPNGSWEIRRLLDRLNKRRLFAQDGKLSSTSLEVALIESGGGAAAPAVADLRQWISGKGLLARTAFRSLDLPLHRRNQPDNGLRRRLADGLIDPITVIPYVDLDSFNWKRRQGAGVALAYCVERDPDLVGELLLDRIPLGGSPDDLEITLWRQACSILNAIRGIRNSGARLAIRQQLKAFRGTLERAIEAAGGEARTTLVDVIWRYQAASLFLAETAAQLEQLLSGGAIEATIRRDNFLLAEFILYSSEVGLPSFTRKFAISVLARAVEEREGKLHGVERRLGRLVSVAPQEFQDQFDQAVYPDLDESSRASYEDEKRLCLSVKQAGLAAVLDASAQPRTLNSWLFIRTCRAAQDVGLVKILREDFADRGLSLRSWRGDKTRLCKLVLSEVPTCRGLAFLRAMAVDEDPTIQWAAITLAMRKSLNNIPTEGKIAIRRSRWTLATIIESAIQGCPHYWLLREVAELFLEQQRERRQHSDCLASEKEFTLLDLPTLRKLLRLGSLTGQHPEVENAITQLRELSLRVFLVLPPLSSKDSGRAYSGSPALGLGLIGTILLARGHDVEIFDLHRHPDREAELLDRCDSADFIGFNTVASTYESTCRILTEISDRCRDQKPVAIVGGQGPTLLWREMVSDPEFRFWDFLVLGDGDEAIVKIVESQGNEEWQKLPGIIAFRDPSKSPARARLADGEWERLPWIDRRLFVDSKGESYEPSPVRSRTQFEVHAVVSRGCAWHCSFCTEAIIRSHGELRRQADDVVNEVSLLLNETSATRVHFIDDNLFPQIAAPKVMPETALHWTTHFLDGMQFLKNEHPDFGFRAIMRIEDLLAYCSTNIDFLQRLAAAGCTLVAFGIEHGLEERRNNLKHSTVTNDQIINLIVTLSDLGIASKGYFIIGGPEENEESASESMGFAIESGLTLAYFAVYKDFRGAVSKSRRLGGQDTKLRKEAGRLKRDFLKFETLSPDLSDLTEALSTPDSLAELIGDVDSSRLDRARTATQQLRELGFEFGDIFKYSDFHLVSAGEGPSVWSTGGQAGSEALLRSVKRAYFEFYLRPEFVERYRWLMELGY